MRIALVLPSFLPLNRVVKARALVMLVALLLQAGMGPAWSAVSVLESEGCTSGCCGMMTEAADAAPCACSADSTPAEDLPLPLAPPPARDNFPQPAWAMMPMADAASAWPEPAGTWGAFPGFLIPRPAMQAPLRVLHCSFRN